MQPTAYTRQYNFTTFSTNYPTTPQPGVQLDAEFNAIKSTIDEIRANLALIQRDDTQLANNTVGINQLKPELMLSVSAPRDWVTATAYEVDTIVWKDDVLYRCLVAHTSGTFATDLAAAKWFDILDYTDPIADAAGFADDAETAMTAAEAAQAAAEAAQAAAEAAQAGAEAAEAAAAAYTGSISLPLAIADGGTGANTQSGARTALGLQIGTHVQAQNAVLQVVAGFTMAADKLPYFTSGSAGALTDLTSFGRSLIDDANAGAALTTLGFSTYGKTLIDDADASAALTTLGVSAFIKTLLDDADGGTARSTLGVTASNLGLGSVENKSSATIRGEISSGNVTSALGYTPMNPASYNNVENKSSATIRGELTSANVVSALGFTPAGSYDSDVVSFQHVFGNSLDVYVNGSYVGNILMSV